MVRVAPTGSSVSGCDPNSKTDSPRVGRLLLLPAAALPRGATAAPLLRGDSSAGFIAKMAGTWAGAPPLAPRAVGGVASAGEPSSGEVEMPPPAIASVDASAFLIAVRSARSLEAPLPPLLGVAGVPLRLGGPDGVEAASSVAAAAAATAPLARSASRDGGGGWGRVRRPLPGVSPI